MGGLQDNVPDDVGLGTGFAWSDVIYFRGADRMMIHRKGCRRSRIRWEYARSHLGNDHERVLAALKEFNMRPCPDCMGVGGEDEPDDDAVPAVR